MVECAEGGGEGLGWAVHSGKRAPWRPVLHPLHDVADWGAFGWPTAGF